MPAHSKSFPWSSHYGHYNFFEAQMRKHDNITSLNAKGEGTYDLIRKRDDHLRVFICECYAFGVAEYLEIFDRLGKIDVVIINSVWCGYSHDAKIYCRESNVGLFTIGEFMAALNQNEYWLYLTKDEIKYFKEIGKI